MQGIEKITTVYKKVRVTVTTEDGTVLDSFVVLHYSADHDEDNFESVGSSLSRQMLGQRIEKFVEEPRYDPPKAWKEEEYN